METIIKELHRLDAKVVFLAFQQNIQRQFFRAVYNTRDEQYSMHGMVFGIQQKHVLEMLSDPMAE
jgi:hypothetical protein